MLKHHAKMHHLSQSLLAPMLHTFSAQGLGPWQNLTSGTKVHARALLHGTVIRPPHGAVNHLRAQTSGVCVAPPVNLIHIPEPRRDWRSPTGAA